MTRPTDLRAHVTLTGEDRFKRGLRETANEADRTGDKFRDLGGDANYLSKQIAEAETQYKQLIHTLNTSDGADEKALLRQIRAEQRRLRQFQRLAQEIAPPSLPSSPVTVTSALAGAGMSPALMGLGGAAAAGLLPFLGGAISSAVIGGVGIGGIIGGFALAARDQRVKDAAHDLGRTALEAFTVAADPMIAPAVESLEFLKVAAAEVAGEMAAGFQALAPAVLPLTEGLAGMVKNMRLGEVFAAAEPFVRVIAKELPDIGEALGDFFLTLAEESDGAILAFSMLSDFIQGALREVGSFLATASRIYEFSVEKMADTFGHLGDAFQFTPVLGDWFTSTGERFEEHLRILDEVKSTYDETSTSTNQLKVVVLGLGVAAEDAADAILAQRDAVNALVVAELGAVGASIAMERAIDETAEAAKENGKSLDISTEAGRRNVEGINRRIESLIRESDAVRQAALAQGLTAMEAEEAAQAFLDKWVPALKAATVASYGNTAAVNSLLSALDKLNGKTVTYTLVQRGGRTIGASVPGGFIPAGFEARASGGPVEPHKLYRVGEHGPEFLQMGSSGGHVYNATQTAAMMSGQSWQQPIIQLQPVAPSGDAAMTALWRALYPFYLQSLRVKGARVES